MNINNNLIWDNIDWNEINLFINKIQSRIVKASLNKNWKLIKDLQRLLVNSYYAKLLAVKRVTSNKGKKTQVKRNMNWRYHSIEANINQSH